MKEQQLRCGWSSYSFNLVGWTKRLHTVIEKPLANNILYTKFTIIFKVNLNSFVLLKRRPTFHSKWSLSAGFDTITHLSTYNREFILLGRSKELQVWSCNEWHKSVCKIFHNQLLVVLLQSGRTTATRPQSGRPCNVTELCCWHSKCSFKSLVYGTWFKAWFQDGVSANVSDIAVNV